MRAAFMSTAGFVLYSAAAVAADVPQPMPVKATARVPVYDWSGWYFGGHVGFGGGNADVTATDPGALPASQHGRYSGLIGGAQLGYNHLLGHLLLGVEADVTFLNYFASNTVVAAVPTANGVATQQWDLVSTFRGRVGAVSGPWMLYATGGLALGAGRYQNDQLIGDPEKVLRIRPGWSAGGGIEFAFAPMWTARLEYLYDRLDGAQLTFPSGTTFQASSADFQSVRLGLNYKLLPPGTELSAAM